MDGSWTQAKAVLRRNPQLLTEARAVVSLPNPPPAVFGALKREPEAFCLSTAEACGAALGALELENSSAGRAVFEPAVRLIVDLQWRLAPAELTAARNAKAAAASSWPANKPS